MSKTTTAGVSSPAFIPFQKIHRWDGAQHIVITEKLDGTNAQIVVNDDCTDIRCGSRTRWITPDDDNFGFAKWVYENKDELLKLGKGQHFGEWWGLGIQRSYNLHERRFSLFNTLRWDTEEQRQRLEEINRSTKSGRISVVPELYKGGFSESVIDETLDNLWKTGSIASPGFQNPEGVVVYMPGSRTLFKKTFEGNISKYLNDNQRINSGTEQTST